MTRVDNFRLWVVLAVGVVAAAVAVSGVALDAGVVRAATPTRATIEATQFTVQSGKVGEAFAVCPGTKRAVGGGVVQSGQASIGLAVIASGPLDGTGVTLNTNDGDKAKQWYAAVDNFTGTERIFKVFAICSSNSTATIEATTLTIQPGQLSARNSLCVRATDASSVAVWSRADRPVTSLPGRVARWTAPDSPPRPSRATSLGNGMLRWKTFRESSAPSGYSRSAPGTLRPGSKPPPSRSRAARPARRSQDVGPASAPWVAVWFRVDRPIAFLPGRAARWTAQG